MRKRAIGGTKRGGLDVALDRFDRPRIHGDVKWGLVSLIQKAENEHCHSMAEELKSDSVTTRFGVDPDVLRLGLVSFLTDVSSEMIFSVFAIFFTTIAGASSALLGLVEGFADFSASSLDYVAGWWSDKTGRRKAFALVGYGFSTVAKIILLVASSVVALSCFRTYLPG